MPITIEQLDAAIAGRAKLTRPPRNTPIPLRLNSKERIVFGEAKADRFITLRGPRPNLGSVWWFYCEAMNLPYVRIHPSRVYASVVLDMYTTDKDLADEGVQRVRRELNHFAAPEATLFWSKTRCDVTRVYIDDAPRLALKLQEIASDAEYQVDM